VKGCYEWRNCAGQTSDAIQFATQMGFAERLNGAWYLHLNDMLLYFGADGEAISRKNTAGQNVMAVPLWNDEYDFTLTTRPNICNPRDMVGYPLVDLSMSMRRKVGLEKPPFGYDMPADDRGVHFNCLELGGAVGAGQLMQLLTVLGRTMDEHVDWMYFNESM
jgi:hypothetical protein